MPIYLWVLHAQQFFTHHFEDFKTYIKLRMKSFYFLVVVALLALSSFFTFVYNPSPLQNYCVANNDTELIGNGFLRFIYL